MDRARHIIEAVFAEERDESRLLDDESMTLTKRLDFFFEQQVGSWKTGVNQTAFA